MLALGRRTLFRTLYDGRDRRWHYLLKSVNGH